MGVTAEASEVPRGAEGTAQMRYVKFGSSDMMVSEVCCGTMTWGSFNDETEAWAQLDAAIAKGVNFFDTAEMYPVPAKADYINRTEVIIGNWLEARVREGKVDRRKIYIATKVMGSTTIFTAAAQKSFRAAVAGRADPLGERPPKDFDEKDGQLPALTAEQMAEACRASLKRLRCNYIDLYQLHFPQRYVPAFGKVEYKIAHERDEDPATPAAFERQVRAMKALIDGELVRHWGLSNETAFGLMSFCAASDRVGAPRPVSVQNDMCLLYRSFEQETAEVCRHFNIAGMPYGPLAGGTLTGKYDDEDEAAEPAAKKQRHFAHPDFQSRYHSQASRAASRKYSALARRHGLKPVQLALAWMRSRWYNTSVIIGSTSVAQLEECVDAFRVELSEQILEEIDAIHTEARNPNIVEE